MSLEKENSDNKINSKNNLNEFVAGDFFLYLKLRSEK